ncbi:DUF6328 family protein [Sandaracinus amylolyticus]|uniref:DUF6328 family protein n=1 Tax=Sandaracinus amylolyticus TaxID=927083 RepID=UPI001F251DF0|nr:DUF6328 family protein [Sandaracinus amylolyticus]UJR81990.1 Hypothetical protein I5071_40550 [Sandaracinus amylolyticus]
MRRESRHERDDRELNELVGELRVVLPGATVLFAFLLTVPFADRWDALPELEHAVFFTAFLASGLAIVLLVGPSAYHRLRGHPYDKHGLVRTAGHQTIAALALLAIALSASMFVVGSFVYQRTLGTIAALVVLTAALVTWFLLPLARRRRAQREGRWGAGQHDAAHGS